MLLIGYGNPGRGDDGLGPALAETIAAMELPGVAVEIDYQLTVDHAPRIAAHETVVFADAAVALGEPFRLSRVTAGPPASMGSHNLTPEAAMQLARLLYGTDPAGWMLAIGGTAFDEVREGLSPSARANLSQAARFLRAWIARRHVPGAPATPPPDWGAARSGPGRQRGGAGRR